MTTEFILKFSKELQGDFLKDVIGSAVGFIQVN
jgi:hypothetical protein